MTPKKAPPKQKEEIHNRALLVNVCVHMWKARKHDRQVSDETNAAHNAEAGAGRYHKRLFGGKVRVLSALITAAQAVRSKHHEQTLPWDDNGGRILPTDNYMMYTTAMREVTGRFNAAVEAFVAQYPRLVSEATDRLGRMYRPDDYPDEGDVARRYGVEIQFSPIPISADVRVNLPQAERRKIEAAVKARVQDAVQTAMQDTWTRLGEVVESLRDRLVEGKYLRATMIAKVEQVAVTMGRLNLTKNAALEATRKQVLKHLSTLDAKELRDNEGGRNAAVAKADAILDKMAAAGFYGGAP